MACDSGKIAYATEELAEQALGMAQVYREQTEKQPIRYYECYECGRFHLTSQDLREVEDA